MKLYSINSGYFKLDGGAMFGVVPKSIWNRLNPADENNMCSWAMRLLLVDTGERKILIDNGIGDKQDKKFLGHFHLHGDDSIAKNLQKYGYQLSDITDNFLTHLHFDHCGGGIIQKENGSYASAFGENTRFLMSKGQWETAHNPNARENASFMKENIAPMETEGELVLLPDEGSVCEGFTYKSCNGHTDSQLIPHIKYKGHTVVFTADLLPSPHHIKLPYIMAYDIRPLDSMKEKEAFLEEAVDQKYVLFFEHDPKIECATLKRSGKRIVVDETFELKDL